METQQSMWVTLFSSDPIQGRSVPVARVCLSSDNHMTMDGEKDTLNMLQEEQMRFFAKGADRHAQESFLGWMAQSFRSPYLFASEIQHGVCLSWEEVLFSR